MYTKEQLSKYSYFEEILNLRDISSVVDSLTGLVSRRYIIGFIHKLIEEKIPFSLSIVDLDNFKFINDTYGHKVGDGVLAGVATDLIRYLGSYGVAGRFGGDEFLIVNFRDVRYDDLKQFFCGLYANFNVLRKNIELENCNPFITGTIGCATFPENAADFESLFNLVDKALYRGKTKGRNCYIIYVESKHKDIKIKELAGRNIYTIFHDICVKFDEVSGVTEKLRNIMLTVGNDMRISDLYYVGNENLMRSVNTEESLGEVYDLEKLINQDVYMTNEIQEIKFKSRRLFEICRDKEFETVLMVRVGIQDETYGYLICAEPRNLRIWQEDEHAILFFVARLLAGYIQGTGDCL